MFVFLVFYGMELGITVDVRLRELVKIYMRMIGNLMGDNGQGTPRSHLGREYPARISESWLTQLGKRRCNLESSLPSY